MSDPKHPEESAAGADTADAAGDRLDGVAEPLLEALAGDVARLDDLSAQLFGEVPESAFESAALEHARTSAEEGVAERAELEELVRLSFRRARGEATPTEDDRLDELERAFRSATGALPDPDEQG